MKARWLLVLGLLAGGALADDATGVIVDATHLNVERCRFPRLYSPDGTQLYPTPKLCKDADYRQGFCGYKPGVETARHDRRRVGDQPLVVRAVKVHEGDPTCGSLDVSQADADAIGALARKGLLDKDRVAIVVGLGVESTAPAADAKTVAKNATVNIIFSKRLRPDLLTRVATPIRVVDAQGNAVAGRVDHLWQEHLLVFTPAGPWQPGGTYRVTVAQGVQAETMATLDSDLVFAFTVQSDAQETAPASDTKTSGSPG